MSELKLYNTLSKSVEPFNPIDKNNVTLYCCGPTVYNFAHIGNLRTYIFEDILVRTLKFFGYNVNHVMNVTDVGHLVSDADEGEDKMLLATQREGKKSHDIAEFYTEAFFKDCNELNILTPTIVCKATEHIQEMIDLIQRLIENGYAYQSDGNVYFDVAKNQEYGKLAGLSLESLKSGARIEVDGSKRNPQDFALWFTKSKFENQELQWDSPWGRGYPGWHIECSAMSIKYLGETFDIHCGGIDHIPVHHTNEIAQSECATGKKFANFWLHGGFLVESSHQKMSKSKGDFLTLERVKKEGFDPISYRYLCLTAHYKGELTWSWDALKGAENALKNLVQKIAALGNSDSNSPQETPQSNEWLKTFRMKIGSDLNAPQSLATLHETLASKDLTSGEKRLLVGKYDEVLGLKLIEQANLLIAKNIETDSAEIPKEILDLAQRREIARVNREFTEADALRNEIETKGYILKDTPAGPELKRK